ncbi:hypothetical protein ACVBEH_06575 [Roseateles sp. GG27B]
MDGLSMAVICVHLRHLRMCSWTAVLGRLRRHLAAKKPYPQMTQMSADGRQSVGSTLQKAGQPTVSSRTPGTARDLNCSRVSPSKRAQRFEWLGSFSAKHEFFLGLIL